MTDQDLGTRIIALTATLYRVSASLLYREADREDAVSAAIEKAWWKASGLRDASKLKPWLIRVLINECHNISRKKMREIPTDALPELLAPDTAQSRELREAVLALPEIERLPILLHYMEGFTVAEIASTLGCPRGTILSRMDRGRKHLRHTLTEE